MEHDNNISNLCNSATQLILREFPDLTVIFIPYTPDKINEAFKAIQDKVFKHPAADKFFEAYQNMQHDSDTCKAFSMGPFWYNKFNFFNFKSGAKALACAFVPTSDLENYKHNLPVLLSAAFPVIDAYTQGKYYTHKNFNFSTLPPSRQAMISDWYGAFAASLIKEHSFINAMAKHRCRQALNAQHGIYPEFVPTSIGYDAAKIILEEHPKSMQVTAQHALKETLPLCEELNSIIPDHYIEKWKLFAEKTQILVWGETPPNDVLGMAIHTSEDSDIKSIASIVSDITSIPPSLSTYSAVYNPFTESEANERHHKHLCKKYYEHFSRLLAPNSMIDFNTILHEQNLKMILHHPLGWASAPILEATKAFSTETQYLNEGETLSELQKRRIKETYDAVSQQFSWKDIECLFQAIHEYKRQLKTFRVDTIVNILEENDFEHPEIIQNIFSYYQNDYHDNLVFDYKSYHSKANNDGYDVLELSE